MDKELNIKYVIHEIVITKPMEKIRFQMRHPENVDCITGIAVTCTCSGVGKKEKVNRGNNAGYLSLAIPDKGDVMYSENVQADKNIFFEFAKQSIFSTIQRNGFQYTSKQRTYFDTHIPVTRAFMEGFYEDALFETLRLSKPTFPIIYAIIEGKQALYKVKVYLRYERTKSVKP